MISSLQKLLLANLDRVLSEQDGHRRAEALTELWHPSCVLIDPQGAHRGYSAIRDNFAELHRLFPDCRFAATAPAQEQFGVARMTWVCSTPAKGNVFSGMDICVERDGKILSLYVFRDEDGINIEAAG